MTRDELITKAAKCAEENTGTYKLTGERHVRESLIVYFATKYEDRSACIEVQIDSNTGELIRVTLIPDVSVLHDYLPENCPVKPNPN